LGPNNNEYTLPWEPISLGTPYDVGWGVSVPDARGAVAGVDAAAAAGRAGANVAAEEVDREAGADPLSDIPESAQPANTTAAIASIAAERRVYFGIQDPPQMELPIHR
jgi:hypothetical protein